ncbi:MAG: dethiobiotin synthase [Ghiorsea sp.]
MSRTIFITGTDTSAGKTWVTSGLVKLSLASEMRAIALKPIASGLMDSGINEDVATLSKAQHGLSPETICYKTFKHPLAPALSANLEHEQLDQQKLLDWLEQQTKHADIAFIEGVGGLMVPLIATPSDSWLVSDWLGAMPNADVMLVVPLRLGCMNHALLSCYLLAQIKRSPKWIILNDIDKNGTGEATKATLLPCLSSLMDVMPQVLSVSHSHDLKRIKLNV